MILAFKLIAAPLLIYLLTKITRRFGPAVGGLLMGIPLLTGPISVFTGLENGYAFAQHAAVANLVGQVSTCMFCFFYMLTARHGGWAASVLVGIAAFFVTTLISNGFSWSLLPALVLLLLTITTLLAIMRPADLDCIARIAPRFDLAARMVISTIFILALTMSTSLLGPQLSGLLAPFPVFVLILSVFTHHHSGAGAATNLLRGVVIGSCSFAAFFTAVSAMLTMSGPIITYSVATLASVSTSGTIYFATRKPRSGSPS